MEKNVPEPTQDAPKQKTPKGFEIPLPKRSEVMDAFEKIAKAKKPEKG
jgi:hypothetical protein